MRGKPAFKRSRWGPGMLYAVPLVDGTFGYAQAISEAAPNVTDIAVLCRRSSQLPSAPPKVERGEVISLTATWRQDLNNGKWAALGVAALTVPPSEMPNQIIIGTGTTVGLKHSDAGL